MESKSKDNTEGESKAAKPAKENESSEAPAKPAFRMPDPPNKKPMAPPPPRFCALAPQDCFATPQQPLAAGSVPDAVPVKAHSSSEGPAGPSSGQPKDAEQKNRPLQEGSAPVEGLPQPIAKTGVAHPPALYTMTCNICMQKTLTCAALTHL